VVPRHASRLPALLRRLAAAVGLAGLGTLALVRQALGQAPADVAGYLQNVVGLSADQVQAIERGDVVVKSLPAAGDLDIAVFGGTTVRVPREFFLHRFEDLKTSLPRTTRMAFGVFSTPPTTADVTALTAEQDDVDQLKQCKPGDCGIKLPAAQITSLRDAVNWSGPNVNAQVDSLARAALVRYVAAYQRRGNAAMLDYADRSTAVSAAAAFDSLLAQSKYLFALDSSFQGYLHDYPNRELPGAASKFYWTKDANSPLKPVITATQFATYTSPGQSNITLIGLKLIYADHYYQAGLDLIALVDRAGEAPSIYLLTVRRFRFDKLKTGFISLKGRVEGGLRDALQRDLTELRAQMEQAYQSKE